MAERTDELLAVLGLGEAASTLVVDYSHGMRKKIALAAALLHNPRVLFLDEPFEAIDPVSARTIKAVLERYTAGGTTVVFSSHVMELVESLCDRLAVVAGGRVVAGGTLDEVRRGRSLEEAFVPWSAARSWRSAGSDGLGPRPAEAAAARQRAAGQRPAPGRVRRRRPLRPGARHARVRRPGLAPQPTLPTWPWSPRSARWRS